MATIDITRNHTLPIQDAKLKAEELAKGMAEKFGIDWKWDGNTIKFDAPSGTAKGTKGEVSVTEKSVRVAIDWQTARVRFAILVCSFWPGATARPCRIVDANRGFLTTSDSVWPFLTIASASATIPGYAGDRSCGVQQRWN